jgi:hypothetical protein
MQNLSPEAIYNFVQTSKNDQKLELIVSRSILVGEDHYRSPASGLRHHQHLHLLDPSKNPSSFSSSIEASAAATLPHSQSLMGPPTLGVNFWPQQHQQHQRMFNNNNRQRRSETPLVFHSPSAAVYGGGYQQQNYGMVQWNRISNVEESTKKFNGKQSVVSI